MLTKPVIQSEENQDASQAASSREDLQGAHRESPFAKRRAIAAGLPLVAATLLSACGKALFGGETRKVKNPPDEGLPSNGDSAAGGPRGSADSSDANGEKQAAGGDGIYDEGGGEENGPTERSYGEGPTVGPCDGFVVSAISIAAMETDDSILAPAEQTRFKLWGRDSSALLAIRLGSGVTVGSTLMVVKPSTANSGLGEILAVRQVLDAIVDLNDSSSMMLFDNLDLTGISTLVVSVVNPEGVALKATLGEVSTLLHPQSKRFAHKFQDKPVIDLQLSMLDNQEGVDKSALDAIKTFSPIFGGEANGFGFDRTTTQAFRAKKLRTAGYLGAGEAETAHVAHAKTVWRSPSKFSTSGTIVTDLLERDVTDRFAASQTTALKDDYNFVIYVPDNAAAPGHFYRFIVSVG